MNHAAEPAAPQPPASPVSWRAWAALLLIALVVRGGVLTAKWKSLEADPDAYRRLGQNLLEHGTFGSGTTATAYRPPLYPLVLAAVGVGNGVAPWAVALLHLVVGVATVALTYIAGRRWGLSRMAWFAALLVACDPILLQQSTLVMTETLATALAALVLVLLAAKQRPTLSAVAVGATLGLAALCRPTFLVWLGLAWPAQLRAAVRDRGARQAAFLWLLGAAAALTPWGVRNALVFGRPLLTTTHGGYTLMLANNPGFFEFLRNPGTTDVWDAAELDANYLRLRRQYGTDELAANHWAYEQARAAVVNDPAAFVRASVHRLGSLWGLVPNRIDANESSAMRWLRYAVGCWYAAVFALALAGAWTLGKRLWQTPWLWGVLLLLAFTATHATYWSNLRMRAPLMPFICLAAAQGLRCRIFRLPSRQQAPERGEMG